MGRLENQRHLRIQLDGSWTSSGLDLWSIMTTGEWRTKLDAERSIFPEWITGR
jgi:hypothetical protein